MADLDLDPKSKEILRATLASPKSVPQLTRIFGLTFSECWEKVSKLESLGLLRCVFTYVSRDGRTVRYYEAELPVEPMDVARASAR